MKHQTRKGYIEYQTDQPHFPSGVWGFEEFRMTRHRDGVRVLRSYCELDDGSNLIRDAIQRVDSEFHPQETLVRLTIDDQFVGSSWYHFTDTTAECQGLLADQGRISETVPITREMRGFGTHALNGDAWMAARYDLSKGPGVQTFKNNLICSKHHIGATGPSFEWSASSDLQYFGQETVTVRAGSFVCYHFALVNLSNGHPPYHYWTTADGDFLFVKGDVEGFNWSFELTELT